MTKFSISPRRALMLHCCNGKHIKEGLITVRKAGEKPVEYLKIKLTRHPCLGVQEAGHGGDLLTENVTLNFAKFHVEYQEQKPDGTRQAGRRNGLGHQGQSEVLASDRSMERSRQSRRDLFAFGATVVS